jgi:hypothetical protein
MDMAWMTKGWRALVRFLEEEIFLFVSTSCTPVPGVYLASCHVGIP